MLGGTTSTEPTPRTGWWLLGGALSLPVIGLGLLLARPALDIRWEHQPSHFWLVLLTAAVSVALAVTTNEAAARRGDARVVLVSLAFGVSAGFLGLHALATPGVLLPEPNAGFFVATPVGLSLAAVLAAASSLPIAGPRGAWVLRHHRALRAMISVIVVAWAAASLLRLPPLDGPPPEHLNELGVVMAIATMLVYGFAAWRYAGIAARRRNGLALTIVAALVLLAEAMLAVAFSRSWHLSWWEWHVLMAMAFALIAVGARREYRRTGSLAATFEPLYLQATLERIERWHGRAIAELVEADARGESRDRVLADLRHEGASSDELTLLAEAAGEIRRVDDLFRPFLPQQYAQRLRADPGAADRPTERTVSVLFADLAGFTSFSETHAPTDVIAMLNEYWAASVPIIEAHGGAIEHFAGDGILVLFNAVVDQPDHARQAVACGLDLVRTGDELAAARPGWPRFHVGINTGPAVVGTVGAGQRRSFATIGDTTNLGARLQGVAVAGQVVIGAQTRSEITSWLDEGGVELESLGGHALKGKREAVEAWVVRYPASSR
jgi:adenylate cyclase